MLLMTSCILRLMELMPMVARVPSTVATTEETSARTSDSPRAERIISLWNRLTYHLREKPVNTARLLFSLKL